MSSSDRKLVFSYKGVELWEVFDRQLLKQLGWSALTLRLAGGIDGIHKTIDMSDRIGFVKIGGSVVGAVGFWVERMQPMFWFAATTEAKDHALELVRFFGKLKEEYPNFSYTRQNERLIRAVERWASSAEAD